MRAEQTKVGNFKAGSDRFLGGGKDMGYVVPSLKIIVGRGLALPASAPPPTPSTHTL